ncbi:hypothetical protein MNV49_004115 [Pseudohyphozyma bogoriensis]|nr:hypothetical protein MNV49_004115 [Pseudohyphozyma bogoriensis]
MATKSYSDEQLAVAKASIRPNLVMDKIRAGERSFSAGMQTYYTSEVVHIMKRSGFESIHINLEHSQMSMETLNTICCAALAHEITPIVVVPKLSNDWCSRCLDIGVQGIVAPRISTKEQAEELVKYTKYRPIGERPYMVQPQMQYEAGIQFNAAMDTLNSNTLTMAMIETLDGLENIEEIAKVPGLDVLFIGTFDLSDEMGITGQWQHPKMEAAVERICAAAKAASVDGNLVTVGAGGLYLDPVAFKKYAAKHDNLLTFMVGRDRDLLYSTFKDHYKFVSNVD